MASWLAKVLSRPQRGTNTIYSTFRRQAYWTPPPAPTPPPPPPPQPAPPRWWKTKLLLCLVGVWLQLGAGAHYGEIHAEWLAGFIAESWVSMEIVKERPERFGGPPLSYWYGFWYFAKRTAIRDRKEILDRELHERGYIRQANELYERLCGPHVNNSLPVEEASEDHERFLDLI